MPNIEIRNYNVVINGKSFFYVPIKNKVETHERIIQLLNTNLLDYDYFSNNYKLIATDLSKKIELQNSNLKQQTNFICKLDKHKVTMLFIIEKFQETAFKFSQNSVSII